MKHPARLFAAVAGGVAAIAVALILFSIFGRRDVMISYLAIAFVVAAIAAFTAMLALAAAQKITAAAALGLAPVLILYLLCAVALTFFAPVFASGQGWFMAIEVFVFMLAVVAGAAIYYASSNQAPAAQENTVSSTFYLTQCQRVVYNLKIDNQNDALAKPLDDLYNAIRLGDKVSRDQQLDMEIYEGVLQLDSSLRGVNPSGDTLDDIDHIISLINSRNSAVFQSNRTWDDRK